MSIKRQSLWNVAPMVITAASAIISVRLFFHFLSTDMYALWGYVLAFGGIFGFADLGLGVAVGRYISAALGKNDLAAVRGYWGTGNLIILPFVLLIALTMITVGIWLGPKWYNVAAANVPLLQACFVASGFELFFSFYSQYWLVLAQANLDFKFVGMLRSAMALLRVIPMVTLAYWTNNTLALTAWGAVVAFVELLFFVVHGRRKYRLGLDLGAAGWAHAKEMASYVAKNFFGLIVNAGFGQIDRQIVGRFAAPADFLYYTTAGNVSSRMQSLSVAIMGPVLFNTVRVGDNNRVSAAKIYNDSFQFVFEWYLFAAIFIGLWHPVLVRLWLGQSRAASIAPLLVPLVLACCFNAIANVSSAQLAGLNRLGAAICFSIAAGLLAVAAVCYGWQTAGAIGAAYGLLVSRIAYVAQDLFAIRLLKAGGWLDLQTWKKMAAQILVAAIFVPCYLAVARDSFWLLLPAAVHGVLVAGWLLRHPLRKWIHPASAATTISTPI
jgi:O-antigen/teichoic acid export membrane protein